MKNIFVLDYYDFNLEQMKALPKAGDYRFHGLYAFSELQAATALPADEVRRVDGTSHHEHRIGARG